ncbi:hypothetical protein CLU81_2374 [Flavobacterium sp. 9]|uniref:hypothetical protein n=1 Tax=Flavobacterium sp. 9 TaxID=2035198 RepID=UPI000C572B08|nr:hypothetical protein [Flavobacterium sp. 9]PIF31866.1 hypothetical protein CLU81_2374 [Flavobacterium sp. 9]
MSYIKEPKGVDFIIQSPPLTEKEKNEISEFIASRKAKKNSDVKTSKPKAVARK